MADTKEYSYSEVLPVSYEEAVRRMTEALKTEGFGVLTEIDVQATLKKKLDRDFRKYVILGACNPPFAFRALSADLDVGLLLPCNVIVYETDDGRSVVSSVNPMAMLGTIDKPELKEVAEQVSAKLRRAVDQAASGL